MARNERRMVDYEWTVEEVDENGDIQDVNFWPEAELASAQEFLQAAGPNYRIGLKRAVVVTLCANDDWRNDGTTDERIEELKERRQDASAEIKQIYERCRKRMARGTNRNGKTSGKHGQEMAE